jgi:hypothetical protein
MTEIINISDKNRFEYRVDNHTAAADYILTKDGHIVLTHTEVPKSMGGAGHWFKIGEGGF